ncbi:hypothetical protein K466DRAFT_184031 [Polyporus arcularius HHB13444]|uniref:Uncharacterized protein n=1 Tax=Polyporus arcularius HHB13444 TaxID=1314778 RepID=A0A5C3PAA8_9APHY|nr:hypothetical protein K466DRAFT_184031 [Polyporus arcularius HHB13444]
MVLAAAFIAIAWPTSDDKGYDICWPGLPWMWAMISAAFTAWLVDKELLRELGDAPAVEPAHRWLRGRADWQEAGDARGAARNGVKGVIPSFSRWTIFLTDMYTSQLLAHV